MKHSETERLSVLDANKHVHSFLVNSGEYEKSPHFLPENKAKVRAILHQLINQLSHTERMIDFGCGTGFILDLTHDLFREVVGVDITKDMMNKVDMSPGNIKLVESLAENTPFDNESFDLATAYSFMDHLYNYTDFLEESFRILRPGGIFYSDLNPNRDFISSVSEIELQNQSELSEVISKEIKGALHNGRYYKDEFGLDPTLLEKAEPIKTNCMGFCAIEVLEHAKKIGFTTCKVEYEWYANQGAVKHLQPEGDEQVIENYLKSMLPLSAGLFKYLRFIFIK